EGSGIREVDLPPLHLFAFRKRLWFRAIFADNFDLIVDCRKLVASIADFTSRFLYSSLLVLCLFEITLPAQEAPIKSPYPVVPARAGERCTVCGTPLGQDDVALMVRGRRVPLNKSMVDAFLADKEKYFAQQQPRAALFQEELDVPAGVAQGGISLRW